MTAINYLQALPASVKAVSNCASYTALTGKHAPSFDPTRPVQDWFDSAAAGLPPGGTYTFNYVDSQAAKFAQRTITNAQAASPNLADFGTFQEFDAWLAAQAPTNSKLSDGAPIPLIDLHPIADAVETVNELIADIGPGWSYTILLAPLGTTPDVEAYIYDSGDPRRVFALVGPDGSQWAFGAVWAARAASGVLCPGKWFTDATLKNEGPRYQAETFPADPTALGTMPYPVDAQYLTSAYQLVAVMPGDVVIEPAGPKPAAALTLEDVIDNQNANFTRLVAAFKTLGITV